MTIEKPATAGLMLGMLFAAGSAAADERRFWALKVQQW